MFQFWHAGHVLAIINHAKFQLDRFRGFGAPGGRKSLSPIDWGIALTTEYALMCYTVIVTQIYRPMNKSYKYLVQ